MANKYRKKQVRAPYRRFQGGDDPKDEGELVYLGYAKKKNIQSLGFTTPAIPLKLPLEILRLITDLIGPNEAYTLLFVCKMWYIAALPKVYRAPKLTARNLAPFVDILNKRKDLCELVKDLDLSRTIQTGRNSWNAKLLRKCSDSLLRFVAAQTNFGFSPSMALRTCKNLLILDLAYVSDTVELPELLVALKGFDMLEVMRFPRNSTFSEQPGDFQWPPKLHSLTVSGGLAPAFLLDVPLPSTLKTLEFQNCPFITDRSLLVALSKIGPQLTSLSIHHPMPLLTSRGMDTILALCPNLTSLSISIEYISANLLEEDIATGHPLSRLYIHASSSLGLTDKLVPEDIYFATEYLLSLKHVRLSVVLGWNSVTEEMIDEIAEVLDERGGGLYIG